MWNIFDVTIILASVLIFIVNQVIQTSEVSTN
jgi:hypothetical protein